MEVLSSFNKYHHNPIDALLGGSLYPLHSASSESFKVSGTLSTTSSSASTIITSAKGM